MDIPMGRAKPQEIYTNVMGMHLGAAMFGRLEPLFLGRIADHKINRPDELMFWKYRSDV